MPRTAAPTAEGRDGAQGVRLTDVATMPGLSRPTVHRLLKVLIEETAVVQDAQSRRYLVGPELLLLGLARTRSHPIQVLSINLGVRRPLGASVSGIVLLAGLGDREARDITRANEPRLAMQQRSVKDVLRLVQAARVNGHAHAPQGVMPGSSAVSVPVPVRDGQDSVLAAIGIAALGDRLGGRRLPTVLARMQACAAQISRRHQDLQQARQLAERRPRAQAGAL